MGITREFPKGARVAGDDAGRDMEGTVVGYTSQVVLVQDDLDGKTYGWLPRELRTI